MTTRCRNCKAPVRFEKTVNNKLMPLDAAPVADGNIVIREGIVRVLREGEVPAADELRYTAHFKGCPGAAEFRKTRAKGSWDQMIEKNERARRRRDAF